MASSETVLQFILDQFSDLENMAYRPMMGEYLLYYEGKLFGGIYDDRLLVKPVPAALDYVKPAAFARPYEGAKEMLLVENVDDREFLTGLVRTMYEDLPSPKPKRRWRN